MSAHRIEDWLDATRPMRGAMNEALQRLRQSIEPTPRITERTLLSPYVLSDDDIYTTIEQSLDEVREVRPSQPVIA